MKFTKNSTQGAWLDKKTLRTGDIIKLVSEAIEVPSQQGNMQIVAKARIKGSQDDAKNVAINIPSKNALIEAFGEDSKNWVNQLLTVNVEKTVIGGKRGIALYLCPEGFEMTEDDGGYLVVVKIGKEKKGNDTVVNYPENGEASEGEIPF